jgi:hypothetical protein
MILVGAIETLVNTIHVNSPQVVNAFMNLTIKAVLAGNGWCEQPEEDILCLELENRYRDLKLDIHCRDSL